MAADAARATKIAIGGLSARLDLNGAFAREITLGGEEIFRGIGFVARDDNWGTPALPALAEVREVDGAIEAESGGSFRSPSGDLSWHVAWRFTATGLTAKARFTSEGGFSTNRTGFVVLHSLPASRGQPVRVGHSDDRVEETHFPDLISAHQPFFDIVGLTYRTAGGHGVTIRFAGEIFEIEDQRNWTDASYKTYCRPLAKPYPYAIEPGETVEQHVEVSLVPAAVAKAAGDTAPQPAAQVRLPLIGTHLPPGPLATGQAEALASLGLGFTAIELAPDEAGWADGLEDKLAAAGGTLRIDLRKAPVEARQAALETLAPLLKGRDLVGVSLNDADEALVEAARRILPGVPIGAGTGAFFTELNRMTAWPAADYLTWTSNPTVHGFDDDTIGETTEVLPDVLRSAKAKLPGRRFQVGPMTLGLRFNPNATSPEGRRRSADPDPRQAGPIAAAWLLATAIGFLDETVTTLSFFEPAGAKGLVGADGRRTPAGHVMARLTALTGLPATVLRWPQVPRAAGLLVDMPAGQALAIAHCRTETVTLALPEGRFAQREDLTPSGFSRRAEAPGRAVTLEGFAVTWLTTG